MCCFAFSVPYCFVVDIEENLIGNKHKTRWKRDAFKGCFAYQ